jgi:subtilisin family serine protease
MHNVLNTLSRAARRNSKILWVGLLVLVLAACGTTVTPDMTTAGNRMDRFDSIASIAVAPDAVRGLIESRYDGKIVAWHPDEGFAILGFMDGNDGGLRAQNLTLEPNQDVFDPPEATAGGWTAWSGGWTAWSGGTENPNTFGENLAAWNLINLTEGQALSSKLGAGVTVAVIDTGVDVDHPGLTCANLDKKGNCVSALAPSSMWADFVDGDNVPSEEPGAAYGHGTGVAGIIVQMAPEARILPIRALGPDGSGDVASVVQAIDHALLEGVDVINLSLGTDVPVESLRAMLELAASQGVYVFASAGNAGQEGITYPASLGTERSKLGHQLIGVSSVDVNDVKTDWANYGTELEMVAPGLEIHTLAPDAQRGVWSGTSFSTPMAAGAMTLALGEPAKNWKNSADPGDDLPMTADSVASQNRDGLETKLGSGRLNVMDFMNRVLK